MRLIKTKTAVTPRYSDAGSAGMDIYVDTAVELEIQPGQTWSAPTGLRVEIPKNCIGVVYPKPGMHKKGLILAEGVRIINPGDRGELVIPLKNVISDVVRVNGRWGVKTPIGVLVIHQYRFEKVEVEENDPIDLLSQEKQSL